MIWTFINKIGSIASIVGIVISIVLLFVNLSISSRISNNKEVLKTKDIGKAMDKVRLHYTKIDKISASQGKAGAGDIDSVTDVYFNLENDLLTLQKLVHTKNKDLLSLIDGAYGEIEKIKKESKYKEYSDEFKDFGTYLSNMERQVKELIQKHLID